MAIAVALCEEPQATVDWCASLDDVVVGGFASRAEAVEAIADEIRTRYLTSSWDFTAADHAINMLAGYAQREGAMPTSFWQTYLAFDEAEYTEVDDALLRARLARVDGPGRLL